MTNDSLETVEKLFKLHLVDCMHLSKRLIWKNWLMVYSEIKNNVLQSWNILASHGIVMHSLLQRFLVGSTNKPRTSVCDNVSRLRLSCYITCRHLGSCFQKCVIDIHQSLDIH